MRGRNYLCVQLLPHGHYSKKTTAQTISGGLENVRNPDTTAEMKFIKPNYFNQVV